ncbi:MAG TPA: polysaccharide biosynthesis C-terminal domain-containing protein [Acidimicrobiales bacterium]|nr:polysaccharide biosynthesis C-terminal domain-containing protein [Acidimicrobiales bacterium]
MRRRASQLLAYPRDPNPYQESLYAKLRPLGVERRYVGEATRSHTLNLMLLPVELAARRVAGHRCLHLHWTFGFTLPGARRYPTLRLVMRWYLVAVLDLCRLVGIRVVWTAHNALPHERVFDDDERARQQLMARCAGVIAHHRSTLARLAELGCLLPASAVIPPGPPQLAAPAGSRRGRRGRLRVLFVGKLAAYKGVEDLLEALAGPGAPSRMTLVVAGECRDADLAARLAEGAARSLVPVELKLERLSDEELAALLCSADVAVLPFRSVTTSSSVALVLSAGCPVIIPDLPALADVPVTCAWRYDRSGEGLALALRRACNASADQLAFMSDAARAHAETASWATAAAATKEFLVELGALGRRATAPLGRHSAGRARQRGAWLPAPAPRPLAPARRGGPDGRTGLGPIMSGFSWNSVSQLSGLLISLALTPFLLHRLGLDRYGLFALLSSFLGLLSNFDGGLGPSATRYFAVHAGAEDRQAASRLLTTVSLLLVAGIGSLGAVVVLLAPALTPHLHASRALAETATLLIRAFMPLLLVSMLRELVQSLLGAHHRWRYLNGVNLLGQLVYAGLAAALVAGGSGLIGLLWATVGREAVLTVASLLATRRMISLRSCRLMAWGETREFLRYASRVQVSAIASLVNLEFDAVIVGIFLPVRFVALYSVGANFATQLRAIPMNALAPIQVSLSRTFGREGLEATIEEFTRLQRFWVRAVVAFPVIGAITAWFAISRWLGDKVALAGAVAALLLLGHAVNMLTGATSSLANSVNRPDIERNYGIVGMTVNIALTLPLVAAFGVLGVATGTAVGQIVGSCYLLRIARRGIRHDLRSFFAEVPWAALPGAALVALVLEVPAYLLAPGGPGGLVVCAVPGLLGLAAYAALADPAAAGALLAVLGREERRGALRSGLRLRDWAAVATLLSAAGRAPLPGAGPAPRAPSGPDGAAPLETGAAGSSEDGLAPAGTGGDRRALR